jgi:hypothetical protein
VPSIFDPRAAVCSTVRFRAAVLILAALVAVPLGAGSAHAQAHAKAQVQAQAASTPAMFMVRAPYQVYLAANCLAGSNFCKFTDTAVPAGHVLQIDRVACQGWHTSTSLPSFVVIAELRTAADQFVQRIDFLPTTYAPANGGSVWSISERTQMFVPAAHRLQINLNSGTTGVGSYGCTLSGTLSLTS